MALRAGLHGSALRPRAGGASNSACSRIPRPPPTTSAPAPGSRSRAPRGSTPALRRQPRWPVSRRRSPVFRRNATSAHAGSRNAVASCCSRQGRTSSPRRTRRRSSRSGRPATRSSVAWRSTSVASSCATCRAPTCCAHRSAGGTTRTIWSGWSPGSRQLRCAARAHRRSAAGRRSRSRCARRAAARAAPRPRRRRRVRHLPRTTAA